MPLPTFETTMGGPPSYPWQQAFDFVGGSNLIYEGWAGPGVATSAAGWCIRKYTYDGSNMTAVQHAGGTTTMTAIWDNRASLTYS